MTVTAARRLAPSELGALDLTLYDPRIHWAKSARASSSWSESYAASTACGPPCVFPAHGDRAGTWLAGSGDKRPWIELEMPPLERAHALLICETCGAGGITSVRDQDGAIDLYEADGRGRQKLRGAQLLVVPLDPSLPAPPRIRIGLKPSSEYQEIDAVALITVPFDELLAVPPSRGDFLHRRLAPSEVAIHDLRGDRRIAWVESALASSEYSSSYSARAVIGRPNVYPKGGDHDRTWLSDNDDRHAWIEMSFGDPPDGYRDCYGFIVLETCGAGAVVRATDENGRVLWQAAAEKVPDRQARMLHVPLEVGPPPKKLRLHVSGSITDYREIDAVALLYAPMEELRTEAPPPPPPPIPGAPPAGFTFMEGKLLGVSPAQPLVHAVVRSAKGARAITWGPTLRLRVGSSEGSESTGSEVELELGETSVFGDPLPRRRGRRSELEGALPTLSAFADLGPETQVVVQGQQITRGERVYVAGVPSGVSDGGGFREVASTPERLQLAAISLEPLSATPFLREGTGTFAAHAGKLTAREPVPHPLSRWTNNALGVAGVAISGALVALLSTQGGAVDGAAAMLGLALSFAFGSTIFALELLGRMNMVFVVGRGRAAKRNGRVGFSSPGWTLTGLVLTAGIASGFLALALGTMGADASVAAWTGTAVLAGAYALVRALMWQWTAGPVLFTAVRALMGQATTGVLVGEHRSTERLVAHSEHTGTEQRVDAQGRVTTHDSYRHWNTRTARADHQITLALPDGTRVSPASSASVIDVGMQPTTTGQQTVGLTGTPYASFASEHEVGDVASLIGEVVADGDDLTVKDAIVLLGPRSALVRRTIIMTACMLALWGFAATGIAVVVAAFLPYL